MFAEVVRARRDMKDLGTVSGIWFRSNGKALKTISAEAITNLDVLPHPARDLLDMERYIDNCQYFDCLDLKTRATTMIASRGCLFKCSYCQPTLDTMFGSKIRLRSPEDIIAEIKEIKIRYAIDAIFLHDDTFAFDKRWLVDFCRKLILEVPGFTWGCNSRADLLDEGSLEIMRESGLRCLHIGAESANQRIIDAIYDKGITLLDVRRSVEMAKKRDIRAMCFFMLGAPTETAQEIERTIRLARELPLDEAVFNIVAPMPGTRLYNLAKELGLRISSRWEDFNYYSQRAYNNFGLGARRVKYLQLKALFVFYLSRYRLKYVLRHFCSLKGLRKLSRKISRFF